MGACKFLALTFSILSALASFCYGQISRLEFYEGCCCQGQPINIIYDSERNLSEHAGLSEAGSIGVFGLWIIKEVRGEVMEDGEYPNTMTGWEYYVHADTNSTLCRQRGLLDGHFKAATRYGSRNMRSPSLSIFMADLFQAREYSLIGNTPLMDLRVPIRPQSWLFSGDHEYRFYEGTNFTGTSQCLRPNKTHLIHDGHGEGAFGMTFNASTGWFSKLVVGSIRYGCAGSSNLKSLSGIVLAFLGILLHTLHLF